MDDFCSGLNDFSILMEVTVCFLSPVWALVSGRTIADKL